MPRKELPPIEERLQRAREMFLKKQSRKTREINRLYSSGIYKTARITAIIFLWIAQFIIIDWMLPYQEAGDKITNGHLNAEDYPYGRLGTQYLDKHSQALVKTKSGLQFTVELPLEDKEPRLNDSVIIYRSCLMREIKKMRIERLDENFLVYEAITYRLIPYIVIFSSLALLFLFVRNIEAKGFAWVIFISSLAMSAWIIIYLAANRQ